MPVRLRHAVSADCSNPGIFPWQIGSDHLFVNTEKLFQAAVILPMTVHGHARDVRKQGPRFLRYRQEGHLRGGLTKKERAAFHLIRPKPD